MIVLGIDPGTTKHGWAILRIEKGRRAVWLVGGHLLASETPLADDIARGAAWTGGRLDCAIELVVIEKPSGYIHEHKRGAHLLETSFQAGLVCAEAVAGMGQDKVVCLSAEQTRRLVAKNAQATDDEVRAALGVLVDMPAKSNVHGRDGAVAAYAGWLWHGSRGSVLAVQRAKSKSGVGT